MQAVASCAVPVCRPPVVGLSGRPVPSPAVPWQLSQPSGYELPPASRTKPSPLTAPLESQSAHSVALPPWQ